MALSNGDGTFRITPTNGFSTPFMTLANELGVYTVSGQMDTAVQAN